MNWQSMNTDQKIEAIRKVWQPGMSAAQIGAKLGVSRNAIIGMFHRHADKMGEMRLGALGDNGQVRPVKAKRPAKARLVVVKSAKPLPLPVVAFGAPHVAGVDLMRLNGHRCKWPLNDGGPFLFCGETTKDGRPWCAFHATRSVGQGTESERSAVRSATHTAKEAA